MIPIKQTVMKNLSIYKNIITAISSSFSIMNNFRLQISKNNEDIQVANFY